jgi:hypothetical protein
VREAEARAAALRALDRLLADTPPCSAQEGMDAVRCSVAWRDAVVARHRAGEAVGQRLALANGVLGLTWSGVVPVSGFRRERLQKARAAIAAEAD